MFYSFLGWLWEMIYMPFESKRFQNRGFLYGPICPIYGFSLLFLQTLVRNVPFFSSEDMTMPKLFVICMVGSAIVEYVTSWTMEMVFHARWWDYSNFPLNLNGRICLPASIFFGLVGIVFVHYLFPLVFFAANIIPSVVFETLALIMMVIFGADYALTQASLTSLLEKIEHANKEFVEKGESVYQAVASTPSQLKKRISDYETETREKARIIAESLSEPQKVLLERITNFSNHFGFQRDDETRERMNMGNKLKEYISNIRYNARR